MTFIFYFIYGMSSFPLTNIFQRGGYTTNHYLVMLDDGVWPKQRQFYQDTDDVPVDVVHKFQRDIYPLVN